MNNRDSPGVSIGQPSHPLTGATQEKKGDGAFAASVALLASSIFNYG
jgi:hypothetical protein